jgi:hypothetical protein
VAVLHQTADKRRGLVRRNAAADAYEDRSHTDGADGRNREYARITANDPDLV